MICWRRRAGGSPATWDMSCRIFRGRWETDGAYVYMMCTSFSSSVSVSVSITVAGSVVADPL